MCVCVRVCMCMCVCDCVNTYMYKYMYIVYVCVCVHSLSQDKKGNSSQSCSVVTSARVQTDFSKESYQRVVSFTCDGRRVVTGGSDSVIRVWEV